MSALERRNAIVDIPSQDSQVSSELFEVLSTIPTAVIMPVSRDLFPNGACLTTVGIPTGRNFGIHKEVRSFIETHNVLVPIVIAGNLDDPTVLGRADEDISAIGNVLRGRHINSKGYYLPEDSKLYYFLIVADGRQDAFSSIRLEDDVEKTKFHGEAINTQILARHLKYMGYADGVVTVDFHSARAARHFAEEGLPFINISAKNEFKAWLDKYLCTASNFVNVIAGCDYGDLTRMYELSKITGFPIEAIIQKTRRDDELEAVLELSNVKGRRVIIWDDLIASAGTFLTNGELLFKQGKAEEVIFMATHALFAGKYKENIQKLKEQYGNKVQLVVSNSIKVAPERMPDGVEVVDIRNIVRNTGQILFEAKSFDEVKEKLAALDYIHNLEAPDDVATRIKAEIAAQNQLADQTVPPATTIFASQA